MACLLPLLAGGMLLGGCALNGDFGRLRPELVTDDTHSWIGRDAALATGSIPSDYPLTDDERRLRDLAYPLIVPPYGRQRLDNAFREYGFKNWSRRAEAFERSAYWRKLAEFSRRSEASAYAQLSTDARNDADMIETFFAMAGRVLDMDRKRVLALAHVSHLNEAEHANALNRNHENGAVVGWVCRRLGERASGYRYALERLVIAAPSSSAAETDRTLNLLEMRVAAHCKGPVGARVVARD
jgi:hypothetical protein